MLKLDDLPIYIVILLFFAGGYLFGEAINAWGQTGDPFLDANLLYQQNEEILKYLQAGEYGRAPNICCPCN